MQQVRCYLLGERAVVLEVSPPATLPVQQKIWALAERFLHTPEVEDVVPGMNNLTLILHAGCGDPLRWIKALEHAWQQVDSLAHTAREVLIPVIYGGDAGPDLADVARHTGLTEREVVARHSGASYVVYFLGFLPGFPYMGGLPPELTTPRRAEPRVAVPAGAVGIGGSQTGIYPLASPGGWQLIGRTPLPLFNPAETATGSGPTLLRPGDRVRFVPQPEGLC
ncbi:sensor histidine kinase inhibitor, KipI family [Aeromonas sp. RU39B]|nr:sensor histidine kinase inhibitor, KipI family [Aeromonas sp. RU39B]